MPDFLKNLSKQLTDYWDKFSRIQKIQIIAVLSMAVVALVVLTVVLSRPSMVLLSEGLTPAQTKSVLEELTANNIKNEARNNATAIYIDSRQMQNARMVLDEMGVIPVTKMTYKEAFENVTLMTTDSDRQLMTQLAFENELAEIIMQYQKVDSATVKVVTAREDRTVFDETAESKATAVLTLNEALNDNQLMGIANLLVASVKNLSLENVKIIDTNNGLLFNGGGGGGISGALTTQVEYAQALEVKISNSIESILLTRGNYDDAEAKVSLVVDFNQLSTTSERFESPLGTQSGIIQDEYRQETESINTTVGQEPGTAANDGTVTYVTGEGDSSATTSTLDISYAINKEISSFTKQFGEIVYNDSSVAVVLNRFIYYYEELLKEDGTLDNISWSAYKNQIRNQEKPLLDVDENIVNLIKSASGIENVVVLAYEVPRFVDDVAVPSPIADYIPVIIIVIMIALLGYAVYKGTEPVEITEVEPELSVEEMLQSTKEKESLEAIELDDKSDARKQIERFVSENPDAVASLLRNWLNEDWE